MQVGAHVTIQGLVANSALNGRKGTVMAWVATKERYAIQLVYGADTSLVREPVCLVRGANLVREPGLFSVLSDPDAQLCVLKRVDIDMSGFKFPEDRGEKDWASASRGLRELCNARLVCMAWRRLVTDYFVSDEFATSGRWSAGHLIIAGARLSAVYARAKADPQELTDGGEPLFAGDCYMNAPPLHLALLRGPSDFVPLCERILKSELTTALDIASWGSRYLPLHTAIVAGAPAAVLERLVRAYDAATQWEHEEYDRRGTPASQRPPREPAWAFETGGLDALELALVALAPVGSVEYVLNLARGAHAPDSDNGSSWGIHPKRHSRSFTGPGFCALHWLARGARFDAFDDNVPWCGRQTPRPWERELSLASTDDAIRLKAAGERAGALAQLLLTMDPNAASYPCTLEQATWFDTTGKGSAKLPLHVACEYGAPAAFVRTLLAAYPRAAGTPDANGKLPIHYVAGGRASACRSEVRQLLLEAYPPALIYESIFNRLEQSAQNGIHGALDALQALLYFGLGEAALEISLQAIARLAALGALRTESLRLANVNPLHAAATNVAPAETLRALIAANPALVRCGPKLHYDDVQHRPRIPPTLPLHVAVMASGQRVPGQHCKYARPSMTEGYDAAAAENVGVLVTAEPQTCTMRSGMAEAWPLHFAFEFSAPQAVKDRLCEATPVDAFGNPKRREGRTWGATKSSGGDMAKLCHETRAAARLRYLLCQGAEGKPDSPLLEEEEAARATEADLVARLAAAKAELESSLANANVQQVLATGRLNRSGLSRQTAEEVRRTLCKAKELNLEWWRAPSTQLNSESEFSRAIRIPHELFRRAQEVSRTLDACAGVHREREQPREDDLSGDEGDDDQASLGWQSASDPDEFEWW